MTPHPKHYLADVPQELRVRVLDLCIHRQWHDALDLLREKGFAEYEWYELVWFHDHAPTDLGLQPTNLNADPGIQNAAGPTLMPEAGTETLTPTPSVADAPNLNGSTQLPNLNASVNLRKPRSKIARLPEHVRDKLNTILAEGGSYPTIIHWLSGLGYPGFNKTNLHSWRFTGFEKWLERKTQEK